MNIFYRLLLFFLIVGLYYALARPTKMCTKKLSEEKCVLVSGAVFALLLLGFLYLFGFAKENYSEYRGSGTEKSCYSKAGHANCGPQCPEFNITLGKRCAGGPYMWQGDSELAKACRALNSTPEGKEQINRYNCGSAYTGMPGGGFNYTVLSDAQWKNKRCSSPSSPCDVSANGIF